MARLCKKCGKYFEHETKFAEGRPPVKCPECKDAEVKARTYDESAPVPEWQQKLIDQIKGDGT